MEIDQGYDVYGNLQYVTSKDGNGDVVNEDYMQYNDAGLLYREYQYPMGSIAVNSSGNVTDGTLYTGYTYADADEGYRLTAIEYPNGRTIDYSYGDPNSPDDCLNRLSAIVDGANSGEEGQVLASYQYLGLGTIVVEDYEQPQVKLDYTGGGDAYSGLDRFNRVVDQLWEDYANNPVDEYQYGYDQFGNVGWKENFVAHGQNAGLDELFTYDSVGQLTSSTWGQLNSGHDGLTFGQRELRRTLEP